jgi:ferredoxin
MSHYITSLCLADGACADVCPVECIVKGKPEAEWPWYYIDPNTCIDCGACVPECPYEAIFPEAEVPAAYEMKAGQKLMLHGEGIWTAEGGEQVDMTGDVAFNTAFYTSGPGYNAKNM